MTRSPSSPRIPVNELPAPARAPYVTVLFLMLTLLHVLPVVAQSSKGGSDDKNGSAGSGNAEDVDTITLPGGKKVALHYLMDDVLHLTVCGSDPSIRHMAKVDQEDAIRVVADMYGLDKDELQQRLKAHFSRQDGTKAENTFREACLRFLEMKYEDAAALTRGVDTQDTGILRERVLILRATALRQAGDHFGAIEAAKHSVEHLPADRIPLAWAVAYQLTGTLMLEMGRYQEAHYLLHQSLKKYEQTKLKDTYWAALIMLQLASLPVGCETPSEAEALINTATTTIKKRFGYKHPETARCLRELGRHQTRADQKAKAESTLANALAMDMETLGEEHFRTWLDARELHQLKRNGKDKAAVLASMQRLMVYSSELVAHEEFLEDSMELVELLKLNGETEKARATLERLEGWSDALGELHPANALYYVFMGEFATDTMPREGLEHMELALQCDAANGSRNFIRTAFCLRQIAQQCAKQNKPQDAVRYMERALALLKASFGEFSDHQMVVEAYQTMQKMYDAADAPLMAGITSMHYMTILGKYLGELQPQMADDYIMLGERALEAGLEYEAEQCIRRAFVIHQVLTKGSARSSPALTKARKNYETLLRTFFGFSEERIAARVSAVEQDKSVIDLFPPTPDLLPPSKESATRSGN